MSSAIYFDGNAATGLATTTGLPSINHTVCFFATIDQIVTSNFGCFYVLGTANLAGGLLEIALGSDGVTLTALGNAGTATLPAMVVGQWYFIAATQSGSTITAYCKPVGAPVCTVASAAADTGWTPATIAVGIEKGTSFDDPLSGSMCGLRIWSGVALTREELERESEQLAAVRTADLFADWTLTSNLDLRDRTGRSSLLTPQNSAHLFQRSGPPLPEVRASRRTRWAPSAASTIVEECPPWGSLIAATSTQVILNVDEGFAQQPVLALEELQPWAPTLPLVLGMPAPVTDEELPQPPPPPGALEEYAAPAPLFALGPWTMPWLVDEELAQPPPPALVDEEYAPPLPPLFALTPPVLFAFDEEVAWQQVFEDYLPPLVFPAIVWAQSGAFYEQEFAQAPTTVAIEEYAPGQQIAAPLVAAPPFTVFIPEQEFVQFVPPIVGSVVVDSIGVGHYIGLGHV